MVKAERVADRNRDLSDAHATRIAEARPWERARIDPQNREVGVWIVADEIAARFPPIRQRDRELVRAVDHVTVREHEPIGRENHTRTTATPALYSNDSGGNGLDRVHDSRRIRVEQFVIVGLAKWSGGPDTILGIEVRAAHHPDGWARVTGLLGKLGSYPAT